MILAAVSVFLIERQFLKASLWSLAASGLSFFGVIHSFRFEGNETLPVYGWAAGWTFAFGYLCFAAVFAAFHLWRRSSDR